MKGEITNTELLASEIKTFFLSLTEHFVPLVPIDAPPSVIPPKLFVSYNEVVSDLSNLKANKVTGLDGISNR